ncbi:pectinesterase [Sphingomonas insulae]|uniref:Pectinesterase catalytic domain-containing protein n=1 Tax=Sphingomonas insulae TaxID=424800 RepID=A0ABN1HP82_9SPHN|nr:pectinesterase family protein [Sphingomonas insulae]NIJ30730.1 pectinesterase [Sphingomonas insulae]
MKMMLRSALALPLALGLPSLAAAAPRDIRVSHACAAAARCFDTIGAALASAQGASGRDWVTIRIGPGDFREKVTVARDKVRLIGSGSARTRLHFDAVAQTAGHYHRNGWGTPGSATLTVDASDVVVTGMTIANDYDYWTNDALPEGDKNKIGNPQAVAFLADIHSDRIAVRDSALLGYQDTLFANGKRLHIEDSLVAGNIDFIFGNGMVLIERSEIRTRRRSADTREEPFQSFIAAPSTLLDQLMGIVIHRSRLTREPGVPDGSVALARPWHPTTRFADGRYANPQAVGQTSFIDCYMDAHIAPDHWTSMKGTARDGTMTDVFRPQDSRFFEQGSTGPGAKRRDIGMPRQGLGDIRAIKGIFFDGWRESDSR